MKITPTAIRQKSFETGFRGFEKKEVSAFLEEVSEIVDILHKENMDLKTKLQNTEAEAKRLKDVEDSLFRTLKTAEDTGASIIEEANEAADLIISEANETAANATANANKLLSEARQKAEQDAATLINAAETKAKETIVELRESMQGLVRSYEGLVDTREAMVKSLKRIAQDALNQIDLSDAHFNRIDAKAHQRAIEELSRSQAFTFANITNLDPAPSFQEEYIPEPVSEEDPYEEMETIEDEIELEIHDESPDLKIEDEEALLEEEGPAVEADLIKKQPEISEEENEEEEEDMPEPKVKSAEQPTYEEQVKKASEDSKNTSGSFFDQFD
jgi:cell division initiation protein